MLNEFISTDHHSNILSSDQYFHSVSSFIDTLTNLLFMIHNHVNHVHIYIYRLGLMIFQYLTALQSRVQKGFNKYFDSTTE